MCGFAAAVCAGSRGVSGGLPVLYPLPGCPPPPLGLLCLLFCLCLLLLLCLLLVLLGLLCLFFFLLFFFLFLHVSSSTVSGSAAKNAANGIITAIAGGERTAAADSV